MSLTIYPHTMQIRTDKDMLQFEAYHYPIRLADEIAKGTDEKAISYLRKRVYNIKKRQHELRSN
jgi:hypothetical protein